MKRLGVKTIKNCSQKKHFINIKVINEWNKLPEEVTNSNSFKNLQCATIEAFLARLIHKLLAVAYYYYH